MVEFCPIFLQLRLLEFSLKIGCTVFRKAPGTDVFDFVQLITIKDIMKSTENRPARIERVLLNQDYETNYCPTGHILKVND